MSSFLFASNAPPPVPGPRALTHIYERADRFFVASYDRTQWSEAGFWIATERITVLESTTSDATLGAAVLAALSTCRVEVPVPPRGTKLEAALLRAMGVRSKHAAMQGTLACMVTIELPDGVLRIEPQRNGGPTGRDRGYSPIPDRAVELPATTDAAEFGRAVRMALAHTTT